MELIMTWDGAVHRTDLEDGEYTVGRSHEAGLRIPVRTVSSVHASIRIDGTDLYVTELGSLNGTDIDGIALTKEQGEVEIPMGKTVRFAGVPVWREQDTATGTSADTSPYRTQFSSNESLLTQSSYHMDQGFSQAAQRRITEMLSSLFELVASNEKTTELAYRACEFVSRWVEADRVVLLEDSGEGTQPSPIAHWSRSGDSAERLRLSTTIVKNVLSDQAAILVADVNADDDLKGSDSIMALRLRTAMAAPLFDNERVRGILYVDSARSGVHYGDDELQVLTATSNAVAVKLRNLSLENELQTAKRIQEAMLPTELPIPKGYDILAHQVMCREVGGDLYHCIPRPNGKLLLALGDVAGKGLPAALAMSASTVLISTLAEIGGNLDRFADVMHRKLFESLAPEQFLTLFLGELDLNSGVIDYVNCGHEPPLIVRDNGDLDAMDSTTLPMALMPSMPVRTGTNTLMPGDLLAVFSDGIPEATRDGEHLMGLESVREALMDQARDPLDEIRQTIVGQVEDYLDGSHSSDDITLMLVRREAESDQAGAEDDDDERGQLEDQAGSGAS